MPSAHRATTPVGITIDVVDFSRPADLAPVPATTAGNLQAMRAGRPS